MFYVIYIHLKHFNASLVFYWYNFDRRGKLIFVNNLHRVICSNQLRSRRIEQTFDEWEHLHELFINRYVVTQ